MTTLGPATPDERGTDSRVPRKAQNLAPGHPLPELLPSYYKERGWEAHGVQTPRTLEKLQVRV